MYPDHQVAPLSFIAPDAALQPADLSAALMMPPVLQFDCWSIITARGWKYCRYLYDSKGKGVAPPSPLWWQTYTQKNSSPRATLLIVVTSPPAALTLIHNPLTDLPQSSAIIRWNRVCSVSKYVKKPIIGTEVAALLCCYLHVQPQPLKLLCREGV